MMTKDFYLFDRTFESNRNFTTEHVKIVKIPGFFQKFPNSRFFCLNCQIPGFSGFQVKWQPCKYSGIHDEKQKKKRKILGVLEGSFES